MNTAIKFRLVKCLQGTEEWLSERAGVITASKITTVRKKLKNGEYTTAAHNYAFTLASERVAGKVLDDTFRTAYSERGNRYEEFARQYHETVIGEFVEQTGFYVSECGRFGASPDGLIADDGGAEYKNFVSPTELMPIYLEGNYETVMNQVQMCMLATGRKWWDFFLFLPHLATVSNEPYIMHRIQRDDEYIELMMKDLLEFDALVEHYAQIIAGKHSVVSRGLQPAYEPKVEDLDFII